ncbi:MAG: hypothetical protein IKN53_06840 [Oscillibacter sp.]|nr:hypothetical protein [Oscillibacter sp.]
MPEKIVPGPVENDGGIREAVCIHTRKIYDACRDKDCAEDLRFYPAARYADAVERAVSVKGGSAELLYVSTAVEPVHFNRGYYTIDMRFYYAVTLQAYTGAAASVPVEGLCVFDKRAILFGSEGGAKIFSSRTAERWPLGRADLPEAVVEAVDPIVLEAKLVDCGSSGEIEKGLCDLPEFIAERFGGEPIAQAGAQGVFVTLGQFSLVRLERDSQLLIPVYDYCMPEKECDCRDDDDDPCGLFRSIEFPVREFFPPNTVSRSDDYGEVRNYCSCSR